MNDKAPPIDTLPIVDYASPRLRKAVPWWIAASAVLVFLGCAAALLPAMLTITQFGLAGAPAALLLAGPSITFAAIEWRALRRPEGVDAEVIAVLAGVIAILLLIPHCMILADAYSSGFHADTAAGLALTSVPFALMVFIGVSHVKWSE